MLRPGVFSQVTGRVLAPAGPVDVVVADKFAADAEAKTVPVEEIPDGWMGLDIGPEAVKRFAAVLGEFCSSTEPARLANDHWGVRA